MTFRIRIALLCCIALISGICVGQEAGFLVQDGQSRYVIVVMPDASPSEKQAAQELRDGFKACTGIELAMPDTVPTNDTPMIVVGGGATAKQLGVDVDTAALGEQGYIMRTVSPHLVIAGTRAAGTLYGVYDFLEQCLGIRWIAPEVTRLPQVRDLSLPKLDATVKPPFLWRESTYSWPKADANTAAHERRNNGQNGADSPFGIQHDSDGTCHSYFRFINPSESFATHPEYFSEIGGVRRSEETQLCLTNPEVLDIVTQRMLDRMKDRPGYRQYNFSQMDWYGYCQCPRCAEINKQYGTPGGTQFWFVNQLAERTSKVYPDKLIGTLAYTYTEEPPKGMTMHPNVAVWLCHMFPSCDSHPIATCPLNADYKRRALEWSKRCSHLYIWHYITDFAHLYNPFPNFRAMQADMRFYRDIGVEGMYLQGFNTSEFHYLRQYLGMKLLWNPDQDANPIIDDFLAGYYGTAAPAIRQYIDLLHDKVEHENIHMHLYTNPAQGYLPDDVMAKAGALFDEAEAAVKDDAEVLERVRVARMPLVYARVFPRNGYTLEDGALKFAGTFTTILESQDFIKRMKRHGFTTIRESAGDPSQMLLLCAAFNSNLPMVTLRNTRIRVDMVPFLGGRVLRIIDLASGQCITANDTRRALFFPMNGGEETRLGGTYVPEGTGSFTDQYYMSAADSRSITLQSRATAGLLIQRIITIDPEQPEVAIEARATNQGSKPRTVRLRSHMELELGDLKDTRVQFSDRTGAAVERDMTPIIAGMREGEHYLDQAAPKGSWIFTGAKGLTVTQRFDDAQLDFTWLYAYPDYLNELEAEVWTKEVVAQPSETVSFTHYVRVEPSGDRRTP